VRRRRDSSAGSPFGPPETWRDDDLIAVSAEFDPELALAAYAAGVFPMPVRPGLMGWWSPLRRGVLPLDGLRVTRSLRKMLPRYTIRVDTAFDAVYRSLHAAGRAHSVEAWAGAELAGGLYGISLGGLFAGESMFHHPEIGRDASKAALVALVDLLTAAGPTRRVLDVQWRTDHLASLGVVEIDRSTYVARLPAALALPDPAWPERT
jgi:leucyl/phenylalanyl-tRNA--protein transferase